MGLAQSSIFQARSPSPEKIDFLPNSLFFGKAYGVDLEASPLSCDPPMTRFVACQLAHDHWFCGSAAEKDLGYHPVFTMEEALVKTLPWLRNL